MTTVAFTGHRPKDLFGYDDRAPYSALVTAIADVCRKLHATHEVNRFISGGAQGVDQCAFWAIEHLKEEGLDVKNIVYSPAPCQPCRWKRTGLFSQDEFAMMLDRADAVRYIGSDDEMRENAPALLYSRNIAMIDACDILVAVTRLESIDDAESSKGGTAHAIRSAHAQDKKILAMNPVNFRTYAL